MWAAPSCACSPAFTAACSGSTNAKANFPPRRCRRTSSASAWSRWRRKWRWHRRAPSISCSRSHDLDLALTQAILRRGDFGWFGLIGSGTKRARFEHRLRERGFANDLIERMVCPIGLPGIAGKEPEVIAVSLVAQLLQATH